jgi:hypothetical protein
MGQVQAFSFLNHDNTLRFGFEGHVVLQPTSTRYPKCVRWLVAFGLGCSAAFDSGIVSVYFVLQKVATAKRAGYCPRRL